jgi:hypothetical protein
MSHARACDTDTSGSIKYMIPITSVGGAVARERRSVPRRVSDGDGWCALDRPVSHAGRGRAAAESKPDL